MRVLRGTYWPDIHDPVTVVMDEGSMRESIENSIATLLSQRNVGFTIFDVFEVPDGTSFEEIVKTGARRAHDAREVEANMALCFHWNASYLYHVAKGGAISASRRAPLSAAQLETVLSQLALHPDYHGQTVIQFADDGVKVELVDGKVKTWL